MSIARAGLPSVPKPVAIQTVLIGHRPPAGKLLPGVSAPRFGLSRPASGGDPFLKPARAGQSLEEMKASIKLEAYKDWGQHEACLPLNIESIYRRISLNPRGKLAVGPATKQKHGRGPDPAGLAATICIAGRSQSVGCSVSSEYCGFEAPAACVRRPAHRGEGKAGS